MNAKLIRNVVRREIQSIMSTKVQIYTDGSARGNPDGPGGYGAVLHFVDSKGQLHERELSAGFRRTTNNRMELLAAIVALEALNRPCEVELYSASKYLTSRTTGSAEKVAW